MPIPPTERSLQASIAAHESWAATANRSRRTAPARAALEARFLAEADGDPVRAEHLRRAHFQRLALKSAQARRRAKVLLADADQVDAELNASGAGGAR